MASRASPINVLLTSIGRRVELVDAFRQAYGHLGLQGAIVGTDIDPLAPALQDVDEFYIVPAYDDADYLPTLARICEQQSIGLVFPLIDPDIPVLAEGRGWLESSGAAVAVVPAEAARTTEDKWLTHEFLVDQGVATPMSWTVDDAYSDAPEGAEYPLFVKPRFGSAGKGATKIDTAGELQHALSRVAEPIVQEYLPGPEVTCDVTCSLDGQVWAVVCRERIEVRWGEVAKGVTVKDDAIIEDCVRIAIGLHATGPITVQCMMRDGQALFTEINARFGGGLPLGIAAGVPSPQWYLADAAGLPVEAPPLGTYATGLYMTRYDQSHFLGQDDVDAAQSRHI